jgi:hypothetical protein
MTDVNLVDMAAGLKDDVSAGILLNFARQSQIMQRVPFEPVNSFTNKQWSLSSLSEATFRDRGEAFGEVKDNARELFDGIFLLGGQIDIDVADLLPTNREVDPYTDNVLWQSKRFMFTFNDKFINGNRNTSPKEFDGLKKRVDDLVTDGVTDVKVDANTAATSELDVSASDANRQIFLDRLNLALFLADDGMADFILTGQGGHLGLHSTARRLGLLDTTRDNFDREIDTYRGIPFAFAGKKADQSTQIITDTEDPGDGGSDSTSFYCIKLGGPYVKGIQLAEPARIFDDVTDSGVTHRVVFQWPLGLSMKHDHSVTRLFGVGVY